MAAPLCCALQVGLGAAGHAGHRLLSLHAQNCPAAHVQGDGSEPFTTAAWISHKFNPFLSLRQACTLLLSVLFVYDVFFVFITPFFTKVRWHSAGVKTNSRSFLSDSPPALFFTERGEHNGGGRGWSLGLRPSWKGERSDDSAPPGFSGEANTDSVCVFSCPWCSKCPG